MKTPEYKKLEFDSLDELHFNWWLEEAVAAGYVKRFRYHPDPYVLSDSVWKTKLKTLKTKLKEETIHIAQGHKYTSDFEFTVTEKFTEIDHKLKPLYILDDNRSQEVFEVDIKPKFERRKSTTEVFSINRKWVLQVHGVYINKVITEKFFKKTWCPEKAAWHKNRRQPTRIARYDKCKLLKDL